MSDELKVSERDAVKRERAAFERGYRTWRFVADEHMSRVGTISADPLGAAETGRLAKVIAREYPLPKVKRPRVVADPYSNYSQQWRCTFGTLQYCEAPGAINWHSLNENEDYHGCRLPLPERIKLWADLLANPTEEVEDAHV